jgi:hypothetical protein
VTTDRHFAEEELVLHYYGEHERPAAVDAHLDVCVPCRAEWDALRRALGAVSETTLAVPPVEWTPERAGRAWERLAPRLGEPARVRRPVSPWRRPVPAALVPLAVAASVAIAFFVGRQWPVRETPPAVADAGPTRVLLFAVGDHLERSEMLLVELMHAGGDGPVDIGSEQQSAAELVSANRLYRHSVARAGDEPGLASVLDELERLLVDVAHRPSPLEPEELADLRRRIESRGLLFRVRILESQVREKQKETAPGGGVS